MSDVVARLTLNAERFTSSSAIAFREMEKRAADTAGRMQATFDSSFSEVQRMASKALTLPRTDTGSLDLGGAAMRASALAAQDQATALRELEGAARRAATANNDNSEATRLYIQAANAAAVEAEQEVRSLSQQAAALERIQVELNQTASATRGFAGAGGGVVASAGQQRYAMISLGQQFGDFGTQVLTGQSAAMAFAQQLPQAGLAAAGLGGRLGAVGSFLTGPWGIALTLATSAAVMFGGKLFSMGDDADAAKAKLAGLNKEVEAYNALIGRIGRLNFGGQEQQNFSDKMDATKAVRDAEKKVADIEAAQRGAAGARGGREAAIERAQDLKAAKDDLAYRQRTLEALKSEQAIYYRNADIKDREEKAEAAALEAKRAGTRETKQAAKDQRELESTLRSTEQAFDPLAASARRYADVLADIAELVAAGRLTPEAAQDYRHAANLQRYDQEMADWKSKAAGSLAGFGLPSGSIVDFGQVGDSAQKRLEASMKNAGFLGGEAFETRGIEAAQAIAKLFGGGVGGALDQTLGALSGLRTGNFNSIRGPLGGALTLLGGDKNSATAKALADGVKAALDPFARAAKGLMAKIGDGAEANQLLAQSVGKAIGFAGIGAGAAAATGGSGIGGAVGGALGGKAAEKLLAKSMDKVFQGLGDFAGPLGSIAGGILGGALGGLLSKAKTGSATIGFDGYGALGVSGTSGNSAKQQAAASASASGVITGLQNIADALGGALTGAIGVSIGKRNDKFSVDTTGGGRTKAKGSGGTVVKFDTEEEAIRFAIGDALKDGVLQGVSDAAKRILQSGQELETAMEKAALIEAIPKALKARLDPVGAALDDLSAKWVKTVDALKEGGATTDQMTEAQRLYALELADVKANTRAASADLKDFLDSLKVGSNSPFSLRDQEGAAKSALDPFLKDIAAGKSIDQSAYQSAASTFLDIERQLYGSTDKYFTEFTKIQDATAAAIKAIDNAKPITSAAPVDPFAEKTAAATKTLTEQADDTNTLLRNVVDLLQEIAGGGSGAAGSSFIGAARNFKAA
jgi:hypothetical protein